MSPENVPPDEFDSPTCQAKIRIALLTIQLLFGINYLASKIVVTAISPGAFAALRTTAAFVILAAFALLGKRKLPHGRDIAILGVGALFGVVFNQGFFLEGLARTSVSHSALLCSQIPTFVLFFSVITRLERFTWRKGLGFLCGIAGVMVLLEADSFQFNSAYLIGDLMTLTNAASYALFVIISRRVMARNDPLAATAVVFFFGAIGMMAYGGRDLFATDLSALDSGVWGAITYVVIGATVVTYFLNLWTVRRTHATRVALYIFLQPVVAAVLGFVFRDEAITMRFVVATVLVFTALLLRDKRSDIDESGR